MLQNLGKRDPPWARRQSREGCTRRAAPGAGRPRSPGPGWRSLAAMRQPGGGPGKALCVRRELAEAGESSGGGRAVEFKCPAGNVRSPSVPKQGAWGTRDPAHCTCQCPLCSRLRTRRRRTGGVDAGRQGAPSHPRAGDKLLAFLIKTPLPA